MKQVLGRLKRGDIIEARVVECVSSGVVIVDVHGDLLRAWNQTQTQLKTHQAIRLQVTATEPLEFVVYRERAKWLV